jgi:hypothetical protein
MSINSITVIKMSGKGEQVFSVMALLAKHYPNDTLGQIVGEHQPVEAVA